MKADNYKQSTDQQLLDNFYSDRNNEWIGVLLQRYTLLLLGVCMKYLKNEDEAKDSVQQIFLKAITEMNRYKVTYFKSWIYMVAKTHCLMKLRDSHGRISSELTERLMAAPTEEEAEQIFWQDDSALALMKASLKELKPEQQQCVTLFYLQKKSYSEVSEQTGFTMLQVKSFIQNGKRKLKLLIEKKLKEESQE